MAFHIVRFLGKAFDSVYIVLFVSNLQRVIFDFW